MRVMLSARVSVTMNVIERVTVKVTSHDEGEGEDNSIRAMNTV